MKMRTLVRCKARELILRCCGPPRDCPSTFSTAATQSFTVQLGASLLRQSRYWHRPDHPYAGRHPGPRALEPRSPVRRLLDEIVHFCRSLRKRGGHAELPANAENRAPPPSRKAQLIRQLRIGDVIAPTLSRRCNEFDRDARGWQRS